MSQRKTRTNITRFFAPTSSFVALQQTTDREKERGNLSVMPPQSLVAETVSKTVERSSAPSRRSSFYERRVHDDVDPDLGLVQTRVQFYEGPLSKSASKLSSKRMSSVSCEDAKQPTLQTPKPTRKEDSRDDGASFVSDGRSVASDRDISKQDPKDVEDFPIYYEAKETPQPQLNGVAQKRGSEQQSRTSPSRRGSEQQSRLSPSRRRSRTPTRSGEYSSLSRSRTPTRLSVRSILSAYPLKRSWSDSSGRSPKSSQKATPCAQEDDLSKTREDPEKEKAGIESETTSTPAPPSSAKTEELRSEKPDSAKQETDWWVDDALSEVQSDAYSAISWPSTKKIDFSRVGSPREDAESPKQEKILDETPRKDPESPKQEKEMAEPQTDEARAETPKRRTSSKPRTDEARAETPKRRTSSKTVEFVDPDQGQQQREPIRSTSDSAAKRPLKSCIKASSLVSNKSDVRKNGQKPGRSSPSQAGGADDVPVVALSLSVKGVKLLKQGKFRAAQQALKDSLSLKRMLAPEAQVADLLSNLGTCASFLESFDESLDLYSQALEELQKHNGPPTEVSNVLFNIGRVEVQRGRWDAAIPILSEAWRSSREAFGENHVYVAQALDLLGFVQFSMAEFKSAVVSFKSALQIYRQIYAGDHEDIANSMCNIGMVREVKGDYENAWNVYSKGKHIHERLGTRQSDPGYQCACKSVQKMEQLLKQKTKQRKSDGSTSTGPSTMAIARRLLQKKKGQAFQI